MNQTQEAIITLYFWVGMLSIVTMTHILLTAENLLDYLIIGLMLVWTVLYHIRFYTIKDMAEEEK